MKKLISLILCAVMVLSLCACGGEVGDGHDIVAGVIIISRSNNYDMTLTTIFITYFYNIRNSPVFIFHLEQRSFKLPEYLSLSAFLSASSSRMMSE